METMEALKNGEAAGQQPDIKTLAQTALSTTATRVELTPAEKASFPSLQQYWGD